jgi:hypothetical protein
MLKLDGQKIVSVSPFYENLTVRDDKGNTYFMKYDDLLPMFDEFIFEVEKKRKRLYIHTLPPDDECKLYLDETFDDVPEEIDINKL